VDDAPARHSAGVFVWSVLTALVLALLVLGVLLARQHNVTRRLRWTGMAKRILALARVSAANSARRGAEDAQAALMGVTRTLRALVTEQQSAIEQMQRAFDGHSPEATGTGGPSPPRGQALPAVPTWPARTGC
jgi:hypothetical protein